MKKQQLKSLQTKNDLKAAAAQLFSERGYTATSIQDIVQLSGYSIGAFYGHFSSKQALATTLWMDIMLADIEETAKLGLQISDRDTFIDYLVEHAQMIHDNALLETIMPHCIFPPEIQKEISENAQHYLCMLIQAIRNWNPHITEDTALSCASAVHCLISSYAQSSVAQFIHISKEGLRMLIEKLMILE